MIGWIISGILLLIILYVFFTIRKAYRKSRALAKQFVDTIVDQINNNIKTKL